MAAAPAGHPVQAAVDVRPVDAAHRHQHHRNLKALFNSAVGQVNRLLELVGVARHPHHVNHGVLLVRDVRGTGPPHIHHGGQFEVGLVVSHDLPKQGIVAETPRPNLGPVHRALVGEVPNVHVVHPGRNARLVHRTHEVCGEVPVVHQPPITDGVVHDLDHWAVREELLAVDVGVQVGDSRGVRGNGGDVWVPHAVVAQANALLLVLDELVVEPNAVLALALGLPGHGIPGVLIVRPAEQVRNRKTPLHGLAQLIEVALNDLQQRADFVLWVLQEDQQLLRARVARAAAQAHNAAVDQVDPLDHRVDGVGEGAALVVVAVEPDLHVGQLPNVLPGQHTDLLPIQASEGINQVEVVRPALFMNLLQATVDVRLLDL
eukprot:RCo007290